jgi:hypothetical protein
MTEKLCIRYTSCFDVAHTKFLSCHLPSRKRKSTEFSIPGIIENTTVWVPEIRTFLSWEKLKGLCDMAYDNFLLSSQANYWTTEININIWHISPTYQLSDLEMNNCGLHGSCVVSKVVEVPSFFNRFAVLSRHTADNSIRYGEPVHKVDWSVTNPNSKLCSRNVWIPSVMSTSTWMVFT